MIEPTLVPAQLSRRWTPGIIVVVGALAVAVGCGSSSSTTKGADKQGPPVSLAGTTNDHGTQVAKDALEVEADDFYFGPTFIKATAGQRFIIEIKNDGKATHTFTSPALGIDEELAPGATKTITLSAPPSGSVEFHCRFHQGTGMQGALFVA